MQRLEVSGAVRDIYIYIYIYDVSRLRVNLLTPRFPGSTAPSGPGSPHYRGLTITLRHTALGSTPLVD
jgi:hypothetical protein